MSYNSKDRTSYVYSTLKSQNANVKVLENSSSEELMFKCEDTIDLGRDNLGVGGFYDYVMNNIVENIEYYGIFNNDIFNISDNLVEEYTKHFSDNIGIIHSSLNDYHFEQNQRAYFSQKNGLFLYKFIENVIPVYSYKLLNKYLSLLSKPIKQHYYGCVDIILSNISNQMNLDNIIINNCIASHERSGVRKSIEGNYEDYANNGRKAYDDFLNKNPNLYPYT